MTKPASKWVEAEGSSPDTENLVDEDGVEIVDEDGVNIIGGRTLQRKKATEWDEQ